MPQLLDFRGHSILELWFHGRRCWILSHIAAVLGYEPRVLITTLRQEWKAEFQEGKHFDIVRGLDLVGLKQLTGTLIPPTTGKLTVLYPAGLDLVLIKTEKPHGRALRRALVDRIIPEWRERNHSRLISLLEQLLSRLDELQTPTRLGRADAAELLKRIGWAADQVFPRYKHAQDWRQLRKQYETRVRTAAGWSQTGRFEDQPARGKQAAQNAILALERPSLPKLRSVKP